MTAPNAPKNPAAKDEYPRTPSMNNPSSIAADTIAAAAIAGSHLQASASKRFVAQGVSAARGHGCGTKWGVEGRTAGRT